MRDKEERHETICGDDERRIAGIKKGTGRQV